MFHFSSLLQRKPGFLGMPTVFALLLVPIFLAGLSAPVTGQVNGQQQQNEIISVSGEMAGSTLEIQINGSAEPAYTAYELFQPARIIIDIAGTTLKGKDIELPDSLPVSLQMKEIADSAQALTRLEFTMNNEYTAYDVKASNNNIILTVNLADNSGTGADNKGSGQISSMITKDTNIESQLPQVAMPQDSTSPGAAESKDVTRDNFNFAGYDKARITVDFYKIDLHNVFRLLREVSGKNIVVDQAVSGSLTLALNDVPWDFALDIILNLQDLQQEERFNTIVIHPKSKEFYWPERTDDNLSYEADDAVVFKEALVIQQQETLSKAVIAAKKIINKGRNEEKKGNIQTAVQLYETALDKWPDNARLANKIASLYLVHLRQNSKAAFFADKALTADSTYNTAALNAAIAQANMENNEQAQQYFDQSISGENPTSEALLSYAAFSEKQKQYDAAIKLLRKHDDIHGSNIGSMISRARILDKKGEHESATDAYKAILLSGFRVPPDLRKFITGRITLNQSM